MASKLQQLSPAEFFAKNQTIAGFDNPGKSLYTTIREFVENSLDAAESIGELPDIKLSIHRLSTEQFDRIRGVSAVARTDESLYEDSGSASGGASAPDSGSAASGSKGGAKKRKQPEGGASDKTDDGRFRVTCEDNGGGMPHEQIPEMLGIVLSSTKYGVKQTRGKYGLGAKMALVWSKKSTGLPIEVWSSCNGSSSKMSHCILDIDISKNRPRVLKHEWVPKVVPGWRGTKISVVIGGRWTAYRARIANYFRHLAVITPYADLSLGFLDGQKGAGPVKGRKQAKKAAAPPKKAAAPPKKAAKASAASESVFDVVGADYEDEDDDLWGMADEEHSSSSSSSSSSSEVKDPHEEWDWGARRWDFRLAFKRRSDRIPPPPVEIPHHPSALDHQLLETLLQSSSRASLQDFLSRDLGSISKDHARRLVEELGAGWSVGMRPGSLSSNQIHQLAQLLKKAKFAAASGKCLSPAGEYNLRLGVEQVIQPQMVATASSKAEVYEGHPFVVEAAVSVGGSDKVKPGITVYRFANRIPLLFEAGNDVCSIVASKKVKWASYQIKNTDKVGVFVSIVSTKIPFKGTSKEYIGDDNDIMQRTVKTCVQKCCVQLKKKIALSQAEKSRNQRKKTLSQYIPNVSQSLFAVLQSALQEVPAELDFFPAELRPLRQEILAGVSGGQLTQKLLADKLARFVVQVDAEAAQEYNSLKGAGAHRVDWFIPGRSARVARFLRALELLRRSGDWQEKVRGHAASSPASASASASASTAIEPASAASSSEPDASELDLFDLGPDDLLSPASRPEEMKSIETPEPQPGATTGEHRVSPLPSVGPVASAEIKKLAAEEQLSVIYSPQFRLTLF